MDLGLKGKRALVLGASQGLGAASAAALAAEGVAVTLLARNAARLGERKAEIEKAGGKAEVLALDLGERAALQPLFDDARGYDILVLNAPPPPPVTAAAFDRKAWGVQFESLFLNQAELAAHLGRGMAARNWGRIVSIASTSVQEPIGGLVYSNALRAGLQGWLKTLSDELAANGVTVNTVAPGSFATERTRGFDVREAERSGRSVADVAAEGAASIPTKRYGEAKELGSLVAYLCSVPAAFITGAFYRIDGGATRAST